MEEPRSGIEWRRDGERGGRRRRVEGKDEGELMTRRGEGVTRGEGREWRRVRETVKEEKKRREEVKKGREENDEGKGETTRWETR